MTSLRLLGDEILLNGVTVATLVPGLRLSLRDELAEAFVLADEDDETIAVLEARVAQLEERLKQASPS